MTTDILTVTYALNGALAIVSLHREPVNSMNTVLWTALLDTLDELEANPKVRGVAFKSTVKRNVFTAGNDLTELYAPMTSLAQYSNFWVVSNMFLARLYTSPLVTIAAVKGACPAGGCCLAMCCDFRIVTEDASMGLNEVALGIAVPKHWVKVMIGIIGQGKTDKLTQYARNIGAQEALKIGLVDGVVNGPDDLDGSVINVAKAAFQLPDPGRGVTKDILRGELGRVWGNKDGLEQEAHQSWSYLTQERTVKALKGVMTRLSKPKDKSKL
jgi:Delta3-Delta2-enoyl-CoA isomerase